MWILKNDAFLSIVAHRNRPDCLLVRSRVPGDIERALPGVETFEDETADYRYRAVVPRERVAAALAQAVGAIEYTNYKNSISDPSRHEAAMGVWQVLASRYGAYGREGTVRTTPDV